MGRLHDLARLRGGVVGLRGSPALVFLVQLLAGPATVLGQERPPIPYVVRGLVVDAETGAPIEGAVVSVVAQGRQVLSGASGIFTLRVDGPPPQRTVVERIGYRTTSVDLPEEPLGQPFLIRLEPRAVEIEGLEVIAEAFRERFERRRNQARGVVFAFETEDLEALGATNGFDAFWKIVRMARPCPGAGSDYCIVDRGVDKPITVCINERPAWGGVLELQDYDPRELHLIEIYENGLVIRAYTKAWVRRAVARRELPPLEWGC